VKRMSKKECVAMLLAGGQGSRLGSLTRNIAKPAVSFGGKYRIIDFSLSNCVNSGIDTVGVLTQYKPFVLNSYIGLGAAWDLDNAQGGVHILPPYMSEEGGEWYKGTANAIYQNIDFINNYNPDYVLIISGDHIYRMDYSKMLDFHREKKADVTISVMPVPWEEASRFGIISTDLEGRIKRFTEKPAEPDSNLASMGIYIFSWPLLRTALIQDEKDDTSDNDFGKNVIPMLLEEEKRMFAYQFEGYWKDVGTIDSYYEANMDLLLPHPEFDFFDDSRRIFSNSDFYPPHYIGLKAEICNSMISNGCVIEGEVINSILAPGVFVGEGSKIEHSILLPDAKVAKDCHLRKCIVGEQASIEDYTVIGMDEARLDQQEITVIEGKSMVPEEGCLEGEKGILQDSIA